MSIEWPTTYQMYKTVKKRFNMTATDKMVVIKAIKEVCTIPRHEVHE